MGLTASRTYHHLTLSKHSQKIFGRSPSCVKDNNRAMLRVFFDGQFEMRFSKLIKYLNEHC